MAKLESAYQGELISLIENVVLPGSLVLKNDPGYLQGIPDLIILFEGQYAFLEVKRNATSPYQPNQEYYLEHLGRHAYTNTIYPDIQEEVLNELQQSFGIRGTTCVPKSK